MTTYEIGDMFWGKSQSYPWWPCVIMTNSNNEIKRTRKKTGTQYHVQFIGQIYDACWITNNFLIKYDGTENFESYVEQQLRSSLPPQHKLIFEMKMTGQIQAMWIQACQDAEKIYQLPNIERTHQLPKLDESSLNILKKPKIKKQLSKPACKLSETSSLSDNVSVETKCIDIEEQSTKDCLLNTEIEEICRKVYIAEETENRLKNSNESVSQIEVENMLKEQWSVLDVETKLLYLNGEASSISKSRVSGRKIKVPSRLRRVNELEDMKKATLRKRISDPIVEKKKSSSQDTSLNTSAQNTEELKVLEPSPSLQLNSINRETFESTLLQSLTIKNSSMEIFKLIVDNELSIISNICHQCLEPFKHNEKRKSCKGDCQASYHLICALNHKLFRSDDNNKCINCVPKDFLCCICKNSKYMKKLFLVKCLKSECPLYFHATCMKFLNFIDSTSDEKDIVVCPNHSCLTCCREDSKHPCNSLGSLVTCIRCPISYHDNMLCIPAGCRVVSETKIICHRHFENSASSINNLTRCFVCFSDNATLRCCRCRGVFHPKCMGLATYADLLKDFVCSTCKLDQPMFHGQIIWIEIDNLWTPAEIVVPPRVPDKSLQFSKKSLVVRTLEHGYKCVDSCELVTFIIGESVLRNFMTTDLKIIECAKKMNVVYLNWRKRMRPFSSEKCPIIGQHELVKLSTISCNKSASIDKYELIRKNVYDENVKNFVPSKQMTVCSCSNNNELCNGSYCSNYNNKIECNKTNCRSTACTNKRFTKGFHIKPNVIKNDVFNRLSVKILENIEKGEMIGELIGRVISSDTAYNLLNEHSNLNPAYYIFQLKENLFLNCEKQGNEWRYLNHSCNPNAELACWYVAGEFRLGISLLRSVSNEEVTINFQKSGLLLKYEFVCNCRLQNCLKTFGPTSIFANQTNIIVPRCCIDNKIIDESVIMHRPQLETLSNKVQTDQLNVQINLVTKSKENPVIDNSVKDKVLCHRCGYHGELILCNKTNCNKRYHIQCVEMSAAPKGLWYCPKHFCIECSQAATLFCSHCSTSHCKTHSVLQKRHNCRRYSKTAKFTPIIIQNNTSECELITNNSSNSISIKSMVEVVSVTAKEENLMQTSKLEEIIEPDILISKPEQNKMSDQKSDQKPDQISLLNKNDLYSACDLVPILTKNKELLNYSSSPCPNQVNLNIKRQIDVADSTEKIKKPKLSRSVINNISNYVSNEEIEVKPEPVEDLSDIRCQVIPLGIEEMENLIISPMVLDD